MMTGPKMDKSFDDVIEEAVNTIFDDELDRDDAYHYLRGMLTEQLRLFVEARLRVAEDAFACWLLGVD